MPPSTDALATLADRVRLGDRAALASLFDALYGGLVRYAGTLDAGGAEDAVQDAFLTLWRRRAHLDPDRSVRALLYATVRNRLLNQQRDAARRRDLLGGLDAPPTPDRPDAATEAALLGDRIREWLDALPERQREAFRLSRFEGLSHAEIADVMACAPKTVENHVGRALRSLRDRLRQVAPEMLP